MKKNISLSIMLINFTSAIIIVPDISEVLEDSEKYIVDLAPPLKFQTTEHNPYITTNYE